jgi:hypothetical protein
MSVSYRILDGREATPRTFAEVPCPVAGCNTTAATPTGDTVTRPSDGRTYRLHSCQCGALGSWVRE